MGVIYRLSVEDFFPGGLPYSEGRQIAIWAAQAGADALHVTAGHYRSLPSAQVVLPPMTYPDATFLDFAADVKKHIAVPVIAVGRLGDPAIAEAAVASGKTDFVALGRTLIADPQWVEKVARGEPIRRCLACNTCINEMRGGARIGCVVNGAAGRETLFANATPPRGERIAVIGAGPAGLTYASLVADGNTSRCSRRRSAPGGAFRYAGKAPLFQEVEASERSFERYIADLAAACAQERRACSASRPTSPRCRACWRHSTASSSPPAPLPLRPRPDRRPRCSIAAPARWPGLQQLFSLNAVRDWFYYRARRGTAAQFTPLARPGQKVAAIGDAVKAGKSKQAIASAFEAALLDRAPAIGDETPQRH